MKPAKKMVGLLILSALAISNSYSQKTNHMDDQENIKELVTSYYQKMDVLHGDFTKMPEVFNETMTFHFPGVPAPMTVAEFQGPAQGIYVGFSDFTHTIEDFVIEGDKVACRLNVTGTHNGDFQGIPASNKSIAISAITIFRVEDNKLSEHWVSVDMLGIMMQIGAIPMGN